MEMSCLETEGKFAVANSSAWTILLYQLQCVRKAFVANLLKLLSFSQFEADLWSTKTTLLEAFSWIDYIYIVFIFLDNSNALLNGKCVQGLMCYMPWPNLRNFTSMYCGISRIFVLTKLFLFTFVGLRYSMS